MADIHDHDPRRRLRSIKESDKISQENYEDMKEFVQALKDDSKSKARRERYLSTGKRILEYEENDFRLKTASKSQIGKIDDQIDNSAYYKKEYAPETKKEYRKFLRVYSKWAEYGSTEKDITVPEKASSVSLSINEDIKDRTDPAELPTPEDIKKVCQDLPLRLRAFLLTHWDLGSRVNETLRTRVGDYKPDRGGKAYINVRVNPEESTEGSKSDRRLARVKISSPAIDRWLEEEHPNPEDDDAFLFCRMSKLKGEKDGSLAHSYKHLSYPFLNREIKAVADELDLDCDISTHTIRKARTTFLKSSLGMQESQVDKRIGHKVGSEVTREYTRLDDSDTNNAYGEAYGEENPEDKDMSDLVPLECQNPDCDADPNPGYRDRCYKCQGMLEIREVKERKDSTDRARQLIWEKLEEKGIAEEIVDEL